MEEVDADFVQKIVNEVVNKDDTNKMEIDPDSADILMREFQDEWLDEDFGPPSNENVNQDEAVFEIDTPKLPFVNCESSPCFTDERFTTEEIKVFKIFDYEFEPYDCEYNLKILQEQSLMRLNFLYLDRSLQNQLPIDLQSILNDLHSLLALLRKSMKSTSSTTYLKILTLVNSFLGHLDSKQSKALFHLTLSTKWTLLESYLNHPDWENGFTDDIFATVFRELIKITDAKFKLFENPEKMVSQASPFQCGCVKKLWIYMTESFRSLFWKEMEKVVVRPNDVNLER